MAGRCSEKGVADTPWAACLVAEEGDVCPHNFKKLEDDFACEPYGSRTPPYKKRVCCLLGPILDLQVRAALFIQIEGGRNNSSFLITLSSLVYFSQQVSTDH